MAPIKLTPIRMVPNKMAPIRMVSRSTARLVFAAAGALAAMALPATEVRADYVIPTSQATVIQKDGDGQCSLWEAIDSINKGHTGNNSGLHGCKNDFGGNAIYLEGANTHYKSGGAVITKPMSIFSEADPTTPNYLENTGGAFVLKVMTDPDGDEVYLYGLFIQRISTTTKGRVIENTGNLHLEFCKVVGGDISGNGGGILNSGGILTLTDSTVRNNKASDKWAAAAAGELAANGFSLDQLSRMSSREVAGKLFDAVETLTWRAANLQSEDLRKLGQMPMKLWEKRANIPGLLLEKGANLFIRNGREDRS